VHAVVRPALDLLDRTPAAPVVDAVVPPVVELVAGPLRELPLPLAPRPGDLPAPSFDGVTGVPTAPAPSSPTASPAAIMSQAGSPAGDPAPVPLSLPLLSLPAVPAPSSGSGPTAGGAPGGADQPPAALPDPVRFPEATGRPGPGSPASALPTSAAADPSTSPD
jgi:hypothetical protein